jgi:hypothetical protein
MQALFNQNHKHALDLKCASFPLRVTFKITNTEKNIYQLIKNMLVMHICIDVSNTI